jgi:SAM-dependent methyltransferase
VCGRLPRGSVAAHGRCVTPEQYDAWYRTPRGAWIGDIEFRMLVGMLRAQPGDGLLDVGCGTGYFSRRFAREAGLQVSGVDPDAASLAYARTQSQPGEQFVEGRAEQLPFRDCSFDGAVSVTALCFIDEQRHALQEMLRVTRRRVVLGLLNRNSLLHRQVGRRGGVGGYRSAHWHTSAEIRKLFDGLPIANLELRSANFLPGEGRVARLVEYTTPSRLLLGGFLAVAADSA